METTTVIGYILGSYIFSVWGLGLRVEGLGFGVWRLGFGGLGFGA